MRKGGLQSSPVSYGSLRYHGGTLVYERYYLPINPVDLSLRRRHFTA
jgi:hypothetical protein